MWVCLQNSSPRCVELQIELQIIPQIMLQSILQSILRIKLQMNLQIMLQELKMPRENEWTMHLYRSLTWLTRFLDTAHH